MQIEYEKYLESLNIPFAGALALAVELVVKKIEKEKKKCLAVGLSAPTTRE